MAKTIPFKRIAASGASDRGDAAIYDLLGYQAIAKAGQPQSLTGESVIQLGALIAQMDFDDPIEEEVAEETKKPEDKSIRQRLEEMNNPGITTSLIDLGTKEIKLLQPNDRPSETTTTKENPGLTITESSGTNIGGISGDAKSDQVNYTIGNIGTEEGRASGENYMYGNNKVTIGKENKTEQEKRFDRGYFLQGEEKAYAAYRKKKTGKDIDTISYGDTPMGRLNPKVLNLLKPSYILYFFLSSNSSKKLFSGSPPLKVTSSSDKGDVEVAAIIPKNPVKSNLELFDIVILLSI